MSWLETFNQRFADRFQSLSIETSVLRQAMEYSLNHPGKRLRPRFVTESAALVNLDSRLVDHTSFAIEACHVFSLVHDDLPCLDNDDLRRGLPTTHKKFGEAQGLLAGDALLNLAYEEFSKNAETSNPSAFVAAFQFFSECIGAKGMILGQSLEVEWSQKDLTLAQLLKIQDLKTGALFRASILCPLLLAGAKPNDALFQDCLSYANAFGFAFQIADDLEDVIQDQHEGAKNVLSLMGRTEAVKRAIDTLEALPIATRFSNTALLLKVLKGNLL